MVESCRITKLNMLYPNIHSDTSCSQPFGRSMHHTAQFLCMSPCHMPPTFWVLSQKPSVRTGSEASFWKPQVWGWSGCQPHMVSYLQSEPLQTFPSTLHKKQLGTCTTQITSTPSLWCPHSTHPLKQLLPLIPLGGVVALSMGGGQQPLKMGWVQAHGIMTCVVHHICILVCGGGRLSIESPTHKPCSILLYMGWGVLEHHMQVSCGEDIHPFIQSKGPWILHAPWQVVVFKHLVLYALKLWRHHINKHWCQEVQ